MAPITELSSDWDQWLTLNTERGVPSALLVEDMVKNGFDRGFAVSATSLCMARLAATPAPKSGFAPRRASANHITIDGHPLSVVARIESPQVTVIEHLLSSEECDALIALSRPKLARSTTIDRATGAEEVIQDRSSEGTYFMRAENPLVTRIERRLAELTSYPVENGEGLQILHYGVGAEYKPHFDFFEPEYAGSAGHLEKGGQRVSTTILYLNDVEAGGATIFPAISLEVSARKGAAVYFSYFQAGGVPDRLTLHGGTPVSSGEKWIATKWVRERANL